MGLSEVELKTVLLLANQGPLSGYDFHSKKNEDGSGGEAATNIMSDVYWLKVRKKLLDINFIKEYPEEGRRKPYVLGEDGFDYVIRTQLDEIHDFNTFAEYCVDYFPLVFRYWGKLMELGLDGYVKNSLGCFVEEIYFDVSRDFSLGRLKRYFHQSFIEDLYIRLYLPEMFKSVDELRAIPFDVICEFRGGGQDVKDFILGWLADEGVFLLDRLRRIEVVKDNL